MILLYKINRKKWKMDSVLNKIKNIEDLKELNISQKKQLAQEIREFIINQVSKTGGHLASNLGVVELTIALHEVFETPTDKIVWDVGHQTYAHKILTGRKEKFSTLRQLNGISGFSDTDESEYDSFNTGHSSTSISAALGIARARDIKNEKYKVIAVIGDGALTGGMALEALNDAGASNTDIIIVLNDNEMSIEKSTGGLAMVLSKYSIKHNMMFEDLGFKYIGPIDGNDIEKLEKVFKKVKKLKGPIIVHCKTIKGKGYEIAEKNPGKYHSISSFDVSTGKEINKKKQEYSNVFGKELVSLAKQNKNIVAITAAMTGGTGLTEFKEKYPDRFFDVEIAEQHALTMAAGMAKAGLTPVVAVYSSFLQRGYDQIIHDICMQNLHVVICIDRAGIVGNDGKTHQGLFDIAFLRLIPNITILAPKDFKELKDMLNYAINKLNSPVAIRYPRGSQSYIKFKQNKNQEKRLENQKAEIIKQGTSISIIASGKMVSKAVKVAQIVKKLDNRINCEIINASLLKPLDEETIKKSIAKTKKVITIEDGILNGGLYTEIAELITKNNMQKIHLQGCAYKDKFIKQGTVEQLEKLNNLDADSIAKEVIKLVWSV